MKNNISSAIAAILLFTESVAVAQSNPSFYVFGEQDGLSTESTACLISHKSAVSAVQSSLRYNQMPIATKSDLNTVSVYININSMTVAPGVRSCFYSYSVTFSVYVFSPGVPEGVPNSGRMVLCDRGSIASWNRYTVQEQVNGSMKIYTDECLNELLTKAQSNIGG